MSQQKRSADRKLIEGKLLEIDRTMGEVVNGSREIVMKVTKNDLEAIDRLLMGSISKINDKLEELEEINRSMQSGYISRLQRIVDTRKEAEAKFLEERQLFTKIVRDLEIAYQQKQEAFQSRLKKELILTKNAYDKLKDDNGRRDFTRVVGGTAG